MASPRRLRRRPSAPIHGRGLLGFGWSHSLAVEACPLGHQKPTTGRRWAECGQGGCSRWTAACGRPPAVPALSTRSAQPTVHGRNRPGEPHASACAKVAACGVERSDRHKAGRKAVSGARGEVVGWPGATAATRHHGDGWPENGQSGPLTRPRHRRGAAPTPRSESAYSALRWLLSRCPGFPRRANDLCEAKV